MDLSFLLQGIKTNASSVASTPGVVTPQAYGAKGDGVTDDT